MSKWRLSLCFLLCILFIVPVFASETLNYEERIFSVTLPTSLPIAVSGDGTVSVSSDVSIQNNSNADVRISSITVESLNGWTLTDFNDDFSSKKINSKEYGLQFQNSNVPASGIFETVGLSSIGANSSMSLLYNAKLTGQVSDLSETIAQVIFVIDWDSELSSELNSYSNEDNSFLYFSESENIGVIVSGTENKPLILDNNFDSSVYALDKSNSDESVLVFPVSE